MSAKQQLLSDAEAKAVILARLRGAGPGGASKAQLEHAVRWAEQVRTDSALLELVLEGRLSMRPAKGPDQWTFRAT